jgi:cytochrome c551/c552
MSVEHRINDEHGAGLALCTRLPPGVCRPAAPSQNALPGACDEGTMSSSLCALSHADNTVASLGELKQFWPFPRRPNLPPVATVSQFTSATMSVLPVFHATTDGGNRNVAEADWLDDAAVARVTVDRGAEWVAVEADTFHDHSVSTGALSAKPCGSDKAMSVRLATPRSIGPARNLPLSPITRTRLAACATLAAALMGCGGGSEPVSAAPSRTTPEARAKALASQAVATPQGVLDWAEQAYPQYFPGHQPDLQYEGVTYRYYAATGNYAGLLDDRILTMGPVSGGGLVDLGAASDFACVISPQACAAEQPIEARWGRVAVGPAHTLVVNAQGAGLGWGDGLATVAGVELPGTPARAIGGLNLVAGVSSGVGFTLATTRDGRLLYLHSGASPPLLRESDLRNGEAVQVPGVSQVVATASCGQGTKLVVFALRQSGNITGYESGNLLGYGSTLFGPAHGNPPVVAFGTHLPSAAADNCGLRAVAADGSIWSLSVRRDVRGSVRLGATRETATTERVTDIACTGISAGDHCLAVKADGTVLAWGNNATGQLGLNPAGKASSATAVAIPGLSGVARVWVGQGASYALSRAGILYAWGAHLGTEAAAPTYQPTRQLGSEGPIAEVAVAEHLVVLMRDGTVRTRGANSSAQLGRGDRADVAALVTPVGIQLGTPESLAMPPVARISPPASIPQLGTTVTLNDGGSRDADGDPLTWHWAFVDRPAGSNAVLDTPTVTSARFTPDKYGTYTVALIVNDGSAGSRPVQVSLTALAPDDGFPDATSHLPTPLPQETAILQSRNCLACHAIDKKLVGPSFQDIANKYRSSAVPLTTLQAQLQTSILQGSVGRWGQVPMPPRTNITADELTTIVNWLLVRTPPKK